MLQWTDVRILLVVLMLLAVAGAGRLYAADLTIYVAVTGNDAWDGLSARPAAGGHGPVKSLARARDLARSLRQAHQGQAGPVQVQLAPGRYALTEPLHLDADDSGTSGAPVVYRAEKAGTAIVSGGVVLPAQGWVKPDASCAACRAHPEIRQYALPKALLEAAGQVAEEGFGRPDLAVASELSMDGLRMPLARWPNTDFAVLRDVASGSDTRLQLPSTFPEGLEKAPDLWARGFWRFNWADVSVPVASIGQPAGWMTLAHAVTPYGVVKGSRFFLFNALELLDQQNEWYLDRASGNLYFWPPADMAGHEPSWSVLDNVVVLENAHDIVFDGITFTSSRSDAVVARDVDGVVLRNCRINAIGGWAVTMSGRNSGVSGSEFSQLGGGGVRLSGGDRKTLAASNLYVSSSSIHDYSMRVYTMRAAVMLEGVGARVSGNVISHAPHVAIFMSGNNHLIERNDISDVLRETSDAGAIYIGRDWTARGTVIRQNYLHAIRARPVFEVKGIYLDDQASGIDIYDNIFWSVQQPVFIGGGSDNMVRGNVFVGSTPAISLDERGLSWQKSASLDPKGTLQAGLKAVPFDSAEVWKKSYPELPGIRKDGYGVPMRNVFQGNVFMATTPYRLGLSKAVRSSQTVEEADSMAAAAASYLMDAPQDAASMCRRATAMGLAPGICR